MAANLVHPDLGIITGIEQNKVIQYRGIPYATLEHQFAEPVIFTNPGLHAISATTIGPTCIQQLNSCDMEHIFIQHPLSHEDFKMSGTDCLNINIVAPKEISSPLPVFVFVHGGGFSIGSNAWPQYDPTRLIEMSIEKGTPVVGININYRLGINGFLTSEELQNAGIKTNNGLRDQRVAFTWIQRYIGAFGGDPENVTVVGESAGSVSCLLHLESPQPLFKNIVAMGGTPLLLKPVTPAVAEFTYKTVLQKLEITTSSPEDRVKALLRSSPEDMLGKVAPNLPLLPVIDGEMIVSPATFSKWSFKDNLLPGLSWCKRILISDCAMDSSILYYLINDRLDGIGESLSESTKESLHDYPKARDELLELYNIGTGKSETAINSVLEFAQDIGFYAPMIAIAGGWPGKAYVFHFNEPNPWIGRFQGVASHILDAAFLFQNYNEYLDEEQRKSAGMMGQHFLEFVCGMEPFPPYSAAGGGAMIYGPGPKRHEYIRSLNSEDVGRRNYIFTLAGSSSLEALSSAWTTFMAGQ